MDDNFILSVKPTFKIISRIFNADNVGLPLCGFISMLCLSPYLIFESDSPELLFSYILVADIVVFTIIALIVIWFDKKNFEVTEYKLYPDKLEFKQGFIKHENVTIKLVDIKEIRHSENFIQRKLGLGSISFITAANATNQSTGIHFSDIENSKFVYAKIKEAMENILNYSFKG